MDNNLKSTFFGVIFLSAAVFLLLDLLVLPHTETMLIWLGLCLFALISGIVAFAAGLLFIVTKLIAARQNESPL
ncbi:MAG: hypothetical protein AAB601_02110 [Patescibacteria group bacterium]